MNAILKISSQVGKSCSNDCMNIQPVKSEMVSQQLKSNQ